MPQLWPEDRREAVCAWLSANGVDPNNVPQDADLYLEPAPEGDPYTGRYLHYEVFHLNSDGRRHTDERGLSAARERRTTPLLVEPPDWWEPYRKPTRDQLLDVLAKVRALHQPQPDGTGFPDSQQCSTCSQDGGDGYQYLVPWPCPTIQTIDSEVQA
ncbi:MULTISPECIES: hypothetical protein [Streptomyces]|uniref:hypothetical protein n=1 Tax=Streptomyces TaxID=1883 RepID=UPI0005175D65|nr:MULTISPECIES: hypothetical protein [Streptomyces]PSK56999.1 hypothetical protein B0E38_02530 [Streptomyces sp. 111WW2]